MTEQEQQAFASMRDALELARDNLRPHGDNCFLHDEGEYNACFCGKDSLVDHLQSVVENAALIAANAVQPVGINGLSKLATAQVVAQEREACALVVESERIGFADDDQQLNRIARAIRARGKL